MKKYLCWPLSLLVVSLPLYAADQTPAKTLRSFGAVGDGRTDDRAAIEKALIQSNGAPLDGEGLSYAVNGNIEVSVSADFRNATLMQTMPSVDMSPYIPSVKGGCQIKITPPESFVGMVKGLPQMTATGYGVYDVDKELTGADLEKARSSIALRTLAFMASKEKSISVRLSKIIVQRGHYPDSGSRSEAAGIWIQYATPVKLSDVEVTGDGKGYGIFLNKCNQVDLQRLNIHDIAWAPFKGDVELSMESIKNDFGWNNYPIYEFGYKGVPRRFVRDRIQEQLAGLFIMSCNNVNIADSTIARLQAKIGSQLIPLQVDGMTINLVNHLRINNCNVSYVWEGIDLTGGSCDDFVYENDRCSDIFSFAFKFGHPKSNGRINNCVAERAGMAGFFVYPGCDNISFNNCSATDTGSNAYWIKPDGRHMQIFAGFRVDGEKGSPTPRMLSFNNCSAINGKYAGAMDYGFFCSPYAGGPEHQNVLNDCKAEGAKIKNILGFSSEARGPGIKDSFSVTPR